jgi:hypothetical protein
VKPKKNRFVRVEAAAEQDSDHHLKTKTAPTPQADIPDVRDDWDVITATMDGGVVWRRYGDGLIVVTRIGETPERNLSHARRALGTIGAHIEPR